MIGRSNVGEHLVDVSARLAGRDRLVIEEGDNLLEALRRYNAMPREPDPRKRGGFFVALRGLVHDLRPNMYRYRHGKPYRR